MHKHDRARFSLNKQFGWLKTASVVNCLELNDDAFSMQRSTFYVTNCHHYYNVEHVNIALFLNDTSSRIHTNNLTFLSVYGKHM